MTTHSLRLAATLSAALLLLSACGQGPIVSRPGDAWECGAPLRKQPKADRLLGWVSISSVDRWIAAVDRIGQRAGQFAPGSSVRATFMTLAQERLQPMGVRDLKWLDMTRPVHALLQSDPKNPVFGASVVVPVKDQGDFSDATKRLHTDYKADGHDLVLDLKKANDKGRGRAPMWVDWIDHATALVSPSPDRKARALQLAKCVETRQPRELLHVGVAVSDLAARYERQIKALQSKLAALSSVSGRNPAVMAYWVETLGTLLTETDAAILMASAGQEDVSVGLAFAARPGTQLAKGWARQSKLGPNPLARELPSSAWMAVAQTYDPRTNARDLARAVKLYAAMFRSGGAADFKAQIEELIKLIEPHSAFSMQREGRFPFGMYGVFGAKDPERALQLTGGMMLHAVRASITQMMTRAPFAKSAAAKGDEILKVVDGGWGGMVDLLVQKSATWKARFSYHDKPAGALRCRTLRITPDPAAMGQLPGRLRMARAFLPNKLDLSVCTGEGGIRFAMGPDAVRRVTQSAGGNATSAASQPWFKRASTLGGQRAHIVFGIQPDPLLQIARGILPNLPEWPKAAAVSTACRYQPRRMRCDLRVPLAVAEFVRAMRDGD